MRDITEALPIICTVFELTSCVPSSPPSKGDNREYTDQLSHYLVQELFRFRPQNSTPVLYNAAIGHFYYHETLLCCNIAATLLFIQSIVYRHPPHTHTQHCSVVLCIYCFFFPSSLISYGCVYVVLRTMPLYCVAPWSWRKAKFHSNVYKLDRGRTIKIHLT